MSRELKYNKGDLVKITGGIGPYGEVVELTKASLDEDVGKHPDPYEIEVDGRILGKMPNNFELVESRDCSQHGDKVWHDNKEEYICPWCDDE